MTMMTVKIMEKNWVDFLIIDVSTINQYSNSFVGNI